MTAQKLLAAIVLCGGRSSRMGRDKASLRIGEKSFLQHTCDAVSKLANQIVVVAAADQQVDDCGGKVIVVRDDIAYPGPLPALHRGIDALRIHLQDDTISQTSVWVTGCDTPFVTAEIITQLWQHQQKQSADVATLTEGGQDNPLLAVYKLSALQTLEPFIASGHRRATEYLNTLKVTKLAVETIATDQQAPAATTNLNTQTDLHNAFGTDSESQCSSSE